MKQLAGWMLVMAGCAVGSVATEEPVAPPVTPRGQKCGEDNQGRNMLGAAPDALTAGMPGQRFASVRSLASNRPGVSVSVVGGDLVARDAGGTLLYAGASTQFVGMRLKTQIGAELEITGVATQDSGATYGLVFVASKQDYCGGAGAAVAMQGVIEADRFHVLTSDVTFGCPDGAAEKCYGWGYVPGTDPGSVPWRSHQACMRMANADIYGNGESHTRNLTPIVIRDSITGANLGPLDAPAIGYPVLTPPPPGIPFFEGAWSWARGQGALCLAHDRWLSEPIDGPPHPSLPDPRLTDDVAYCEDLTIEQMVDRGALMFNASRRMDMYLNRWRNPTTGDLLTSLRGAYNHRTERRIPPIPGFTEFLGNDAVMLRNLTGTLTEADVTPMFMQHNPATGDFVVATATPVAPGYVIEDPEHAFEGYTLNAPAPDLIPFGLYVKGTDYVSASGGPGTLGYTFVGPLHYVMRSAMADVLPGGAAPRPALGPRAAARACSEQ